jgi:hypothetical protein
VKPPRQHDTAYRKGRAAFKAKHKALRTPCHICNGELGPIDYDAQPQTSKAFELDHILPSSTHPHLYYDEGNWAPSHVACNRSRQAKDLQKVQPPQAPSGMWVKANW